MGFVPRFPGRKREGEEGLYTLNFRRALGAPGCPICRLVREGEERGIWTWLYELSGDPELHRRLATSLGLCRRHASLARLVVEERHLVTPSGVARLYGSVVRSLLERPRRGFTTRPPSPERGCPLCGYAGRTAGHYAALAASLLEEGEWRERFRNSEGFCLPHLRLVWEAAGQGVRRFLLRDLEERLADLSRRLEELQKKQRYDVPEALRPGEADSWREALWRFGGMEFRGLLTEEP